MNHSVFKIGLCSDIHSHRHDQDDQVRALLQYIKAQPLPDVLIYAGDISNRVSEIKAFLQQLDVPTVKVWVPGNHDIWVFDPESATDSAEYRYSFLFPKLSVEIGWLYLPAGPALFPDKELAIVGTIGWFTGNAYSEWFDRQSDRGDLELARRFADDLNDQVNSVPTSWRLIVVTHHISHSLCPSYDPDQENTWNKHIQDLLNEISSRVATVINGHLHVRYEPVRINGLQFAAHPFGYPHQHSKVEDGYTVLPIDL
jgi:3',5'-cyclic AMP phosphodiesterase CpdA